MWCENLQILIIDNQIFSIFFNPYIFIFQLSLHFKYRFYSSVLPPGSSSGSPRLPLLQSNASESGSGILANKDLLYLGDVSAPVDVGHQAASHQNILDYLK